MVYTSPWFLAGVYFSCCLFPSLVAIAFKSFDLFSYLNIGLLGIVMVRTEIIEDSWVLILMPNRSASGSQNRLFFLVLAMVAGLIAFAWSLVGVWVILPFAGLEIGLVGYFLRLTYLKNQASQTITIDTSEIEVEYITLNSSQLTSLSRESTQLSFSKSINTAFIENIFLFDHKNKVEVGQFLSKEDRESLIHSLRQSGVQIQDYSNSWMAV